MNAVLASHDKERKSASSKKRGVRLAMLQNFGFIFSVVVVLFCCCGQELFSRGFCIAQSNNKELN